MATKIRTLNHDVEYNSKRDNVNNKSGFYEPRQKISIRGKLRSPEVREYGKARSYSRVKDYKLKEGGEKVREYTNVKEYDHVFDCFPDDPEWKERKRASANWRKAAKAAREPFCKPYKSIWSVKRTLHITDNKKEPLHESVRRPQQVQLDFKPNPNLPFDF